MPAPSIPFRDLQTAFMYVSGGPPFERNAYIAKDTGQVYQAGQGYDAFKRVPVDVDDNERYWSVPHRQDLDLGGKLELKFVEDYIPEKFAVAEEFFHRRGAHAKFHDLVEQQGMDAHWRQYEHEATVKALRLWAQVEGLSLAS